MSVIRSIRSMPLHKRLAIAVAWGVVSFGSLFAVIDYSGSGQLTLLKSDAWHVGHCASGKLTTSDGTRAPEFLVAAAFSNVAAEQGLSLAEMKQGYNDYIPGKSYHNSCRVARELEARL
jgi:hypothetical protein